MKSHFLTALLFIAITSQAQEFNHQAIVERLADIMNKNYVYPEKGQDMYDLLHSKIKDGTYASIENRSALADALQVDLRSIINDRHIRVTHNPARAKRMNEGPRSTGRQGPKNYGFQEVSILDGNIGYLDLRGFAGIGNAEEVAREAMDKLIQADAIIFDLRRNGGGSPSMIRFISSYLFGPEPVHLNTFYWRPADRYEESWTHPKDVSVNRPDVPVYVLTSDYTFSAAEEFTYNLKNLERATIIGETTGGGAHPGGPMIIEDGFIVNVPQGRAINPITNTNWEGVGIDPHIAMSSEKALDKAIELAQEDISRK